MNYEVKFKVVRTIYVTDVDNEEKAIEAASNQLLNMFIQSIRGHIEIETIRTDVPDRKDLI